jgi:trans-aconitate methyltransferase
LAISKQQWNAALYDGNHAFVARFGGDLLELLQPRVEEHILDLGCGTGELTAQIAAVGAQVVGVDASAEMVAEAKRKFPTLDFFQVDALALSDQQPHGHFDAIFSNAVLHWVKEPGRALQNMAICLREGGRLVLEMGGARNVECIRRALGEALAARAIPAVESPWYFPSLSEYAHLVESVGLRVGAAWHFARPTRLEAEQNGLRNWLAMFAGTYLRELDEDLCGAVLADVEGRLRAELFRDNAWWADYWRLRLVAHKD